MNLLLQLAASPLVSCSLQEHFRPSVCVQRYVESGGWPSRSVIFTRCLPQRPPTELLLLVLLLQLSSSNKSNWDV